MSKNIQTRHQRKYMDDRQAHEKMLNVTWGMWVIWLGVIPQTKRPQV